MAINCCQNDTVLRNHHCRWVIAWPDPTLGQTCRLVARPHNLDKRLLQKGKRFQSPGLAVGLGWIGMGDSSPVTRL
jgi:hypothetical protein